MSNRQDLKLKKLTQCSIKIPTILCTQPKLLADSLLSMTPREGETLKMYSNRYWKIFNEIDGGFDDVAIRTFKVGIPAKHGLRKFLTGKPANSVRQLMD